MDLRRDGRGLDLVGCSGRGPGGARGDTQEGADVVLLGVVVTFAETDLTVYKTSRLAGRLNLQLRLEFYNLFNHHNLYLQNDLASGGFGKAISEQLPRWWQLGAKLSF